MKPGFSMVSCGVAILAALAATPAESTEAGDMFARTTVIGVVPLSKSGVTQHVYRQIDRLVPKLRKIAAERVVKLECGYDVGNAHGKDVLESYLIAGQVEKYLREHHRLNLDIWITAFTDEQVRSERARLTFSVFPDQVKHLESQPADQFVAAE